MTENKGSITVSPGLATLLFVLFLGLKLTGYIDWSWWWVTAPLWIPFGLFLIVSIVLSAIVTWRE